MSPCNGKRMTITAQKVIAVTPLGQALAIQNSEIAPTATKTRTALMKGRSQSATCSRAVPLTPTMSRGSITPANPLRPRAMPSMPRAALSASNLWIGVLALKRVSDRAAERHASRNSAGSSAEPGGARRQPRARQLVVNGVGLPFGRRVAAAGDRKRNLAPGRNRLHESRHGPLQHRRTIAEIGRLADRRIDHRIERDHAPQEFASKRSKMKNVGAGVPEAIGEPVHDRGRESAEFRRQLPA